jgi:hypothetical protein
MEEGLPFFGLEFSSQQVFYQKIVIPAIDDLEAGKAVVFLPAVREGNLVPQLAAPDLEVFAGRRALSDHSRSPLQPKDKERCLSPASLEPAEFAGNRMPFVLFIGTNNRTSFASL